jgi:hypothetical protein
LRRCAVTKEIADIHDEDVAMKLTKRIDEAGPPGQAALIGGVSPTGIQFTFRIRGEDKHKPLGFLALDQAGCPQQDKAQEHQEAHC